MWLHVILLIALVAQTQTPPQPSVLVTRYRDSDEVMLWGQGTPDGAMYEYSVPKKVFVKLPAWNVEKDPPPLSITRALEIARKTTRAEYPELKELLPWTISINSVGAGERQSRWFYIFTMYPATNGERSANSNVTAVVLMDGTVVKPKERKTAK
jgi:hypothetical protein